MLKFLTALSLLSLVNSAWAASRVCSRDFQDDLSSCYVEGGVEECKERLASRPRDLGVRLALCDGYVDQGDIEAAKNVLQDGMEIRSGSVEESRIKLALSNLDEFVRPAATDPGPGVSIAFLRFQCIEREIVDVNDCKELIQRDPNSAEPHIKIAELALKEGDLDTAIQNYRDAVGKGADGSLQAKLNDLLASQKNLQQCFADINTRSLNACRQAYRSGFGDLENILLKTGDIHLLSERWAEAREAYVDAEGVGAQTARRRVETLVNSRECLEPERVDGIAQCRAALSGINAIKYSNRFRDKLMVSNCRQLLHLNEPSALAFCEDSLSIVGADGVELITKLLPRPEINNPPPVVVPTPEERKLASCEMHLGGSNPDPQFSDCLTVLSSPTLAVTHAGELRKISQQIDTLASEPPLESAGPPVRDHNRPLQRANEPLELVEGRYVVTY